MSGRLIRQVEWVTRAQVRAEKNKLFVFGDNMERNGLGGQAGAMRHMVNTIGVPTKWSPNASHTGFFRNEDLGNPFVRLAIDHAFQLMEDALLMGLDVVIPADGLGSGLSELPQRAPYIDRYIRDKITSLEAVQEKV